jgi:hypothetical protein
MVAPKGTIRESEIIHGLACDRTCEIAGGTPNTNVYRTYVHMVLRQYASSKLKRLFMQHQSIVKPPECIMRASKTAHCSACKTTYLIEGQKQNPK